MLKVCIDSNVYISALAFGGKPTKVVELALARKFNLITSFAILNEVKRNLIQKLNLSETDDSRILKRSTADCRYI